MRRSLDQLRSAFGRVFAAGPYTALAAALALLVFLLAVWFPNFGLLAQVYSASDAPVPATLGIALTLLGGLGTNFSLLAAGYTVAISVLFGIVTAMVAYAVRQRRMHSARQGIAVGSGAAISGLLGLGCAACGSLILSVLAPALGASGALAALPLAGQEFGIASVLLLLASLLLVSKGIAQPMECPIAASAGVRRPEQDTASPGEANPRPQTKGTEHENATQT